MARPIAVGLKYFPFDVDLLDDEALDFLRNKYGMIVNEVYIGLLCLLYKKYGYYIPYETEKEKEDCTWYIYKHIRGGKYSPDTKTVATVIDACVARELFSRELYPKIITSKRAQSTFYSCTAERKSVPISQEIWLLDLKDMEKLSTKHPYYIEVTRQNKSDDKPSFSDDKPNKSDDKPLNKTKLNITSNEVINTHSNAREEEFELLNYDTLLQVVKEECPIVFNRHQAKVDKGNLQIVRDIMQILEQLQDQYSYKQLREIFKKANKIFCVKPSYSGCDIKWVLNNISLVLSEEESKSSEQSKSKPKGYWDDALDKLGRID